MKLPKTTKRFCPFCKKRTEQKIDLVSTGHKRATLKKGSKERAAKRHEVPGKGQSIYQKKLERKTKVTTKKLVIYTCKECKKSKHAKKGRRVSKLIIE